MSATQGGPRRPNLWPGVAAFAAGLAVWNAVFSATGAWWHLWWLGLAGDFALVVLVAERIGRMVPPARRRLYERTLAFGFPVLGLIAWQLIVDAGIL